MNPHRHRVWLVALAGGSLLLPACATSATTQAPQTNPAAGFVKAWSYVGKQPPPFWWHDLVDVKGAWDKGATGDGRTVAIVDTGVLKPHEDLRDANTLEGMQFCTTSNPSDTADTNGHGTQLAGIVLGRVPTLAHSTRGVAPDAKLIPIKVVCAVTTTPAVAQGVQKATSTTPDVILMALGAWPSDTDLGGNDVDSLMATLVSVNPNILFVVASVWDLTYFPRPEWTTKYGNVIVVAGMTVYDMKEVPFNEKRGDIWAPAQNVETASISPDPKDPKKHAQFLMPGTSAASAIVAGCAALIKQMNLAYTGKALKDALTAAVVPQPDLPGGRLKCSMAFLSSRAR